MAERGAFILATAGHVDHGKSALVRALTGVEPDRLPAEKARGVTIELGFAHFSIGALDVGVIDVPGHDDFVKNMVAGVGAIDLALLVIAADDGWMPQTEEHLQILCHLGVTRAVVALTKVDLVDDVSVVEGELRARLAASPFADASIVRTSTRSNFGIDELVAAIGAALIGSTPRADIGKPRLSVDRAFSLRGIGTIVTGTLIGGSLVTGEAIVVQPAGATASVRRLQTFGRDVSRAPPGSRVAINLPGVDVSTRDTAADGNEIRRGDVVTVADVGVVTRSVDVEIARSPRAPDAAQLHSGRRIVVHHGSRSTFAIVRTFDRAAISGGRRALAQLRFERPMLLVIGDRLLVRDSTQRETLAGAIALDVSPPSSHRAKTIAAQRRMLEARAVDLSPAGVIASALARDGYASANTLARSVDTSRTTLIAAIDAGVARGEWRRVDELVVAATTWRHAVESIAKAVDDHHLAHPDHAGASLTLLRSKTKDVVDELIFDAVVAALSMEAFERVGTLLRRRSHRATLPARLEPAGMEICALLNARPFDPPSRKELAGDDSSVQALRFLIADVAIVEIGTDVVMTSDAYRAAATTVAQRLRAGPAATVSELKQCLGSSRRVVVPLLERFDREGITRRVGDRREIGPHAPL